VLAERNRRPAGETLLLGGHVDQCGCPDAEPGNFKRLKGTQEPVEAYRAVEDERPGRASVTESHPDSSRQRARLRGFYSFLDEVDEIDRSVCGVTMALGTLRRCHRSSHAGLGTDRMPFKPFPMPARCGRGFPWA
jgi:hypothetical protein